MENALLDGYATGTAMRASGASVHSHGADLRDDLSGVGYWLDTSGLTVDQTVDRLLATGISPLSVVRRAHGHRTMQESRPVRAADPAQLDTR